MSLARCNMMLVYRSSATACGMWGSLETWRCGGIKKQQWSRNNSEHFLQARYRFWLYTNRWCRRIYYTNGSMIWPPFLLVPGMLECFGSWPGRGPAASAFGSRVRWVAGSWDHWSWHGLESSRKTIEEHLHWSHHLSSFIQMGLRVPNCNWKKLWKHLYEFGPHFPGNVSLWGCRAFTAHSARSAAAVVAMGFDPTVIDCPRQPNG